MTRLARLLGSTGVAIWTLALLGAATPTFWVVSTQADFLKGEVEALSIDGTGRILLGPSTMVVADTSVPVLWTIVPASDGGFWVGSGNDGKVLRMAIDGEVATVFDSPELAVHALAPAPEGGVYAATSPDGKIYRVGADGSSSVVFDPAEKYIWALTVDSSGALFAGTGERGAVYRIEPDGTGRLFYDTGTTHVVSLALDRAGRVIAGTESPGRVYRIDRDAKGFVLIDSPFKEIHSLRIDDAGVIYAAAIDGEGPKEPGAAPAGGPPEAPRPAPVPSVSTEISAIAIIDTGGGAPQVAPPSRREAARSPTGAVYRIRPDGEWDQVWESTEDTPFDIVITGPDDVLIGTGGTGKIFRVGGQPTRVTLVTRATAQQVTRFLQSDGGDVLAVTANPGKLIRLSRGPGTEGTYLSEVRDAGTVATWGTIRWRATGGGSVQITTRSGNTASPDETWSEWSAPYRDADGEAVTSPKARYLQWRAVLRGAPGSPTGPALTSVTTAYLPRNQKPVVTAVTVHPPGLVFQRPFPTGDVVELAGFDATPTDGRPGVSPATSVSQVVMGRRLFQKGLQTLAWTATDPDNDTLQFDVLYRRDDETDWKPLKRGLWEPIVVWDTTSVPDGAYTVKVVASDAPLNAPESALVGETESGSFDIDNTPPVIEVQTAGRDARGLVLTVVVRDTHSAVQRVEYSVDAERWKPMYPKDGLPDSQVEEYDLVLDDDGGLAGVIIRATDAMGNVATTKGGQDP